MTASPAHVNLAAAKAAVFADFPAGHPGREAVLALPDRISVGTFDSLFPVLLRLLRAPSAGGRPGTDTTARGMEVPCQRPSVY